MKLFCRNSSLRLQIGSDENPMFFYKPLKFFQGEKLNFEFLQNSVHNFKIGGQ